MRITVNILISGGSSGLGLYFCEMLTKEHTVYSLSRRKPELDSQNFHPIFCDLSKANEIQEVTERVRNLNIDSYIHCAGTWESSLKLSKVSAEEAQGILNVNLMSFLSIASALEVSLKKSQSPSIIAIGSTAGLDHSTGKRSIYAASKFGLRGAVHSLWEYYKEALIKVCIINPGGLEEYPPVQEGTKIKNNNRIPLLDIYKILSTIYSTSYNLNIKEINLTAMSDDI